MPFFPVLQKSKQYLWIKNFHLSTSSFTVEEVTEREEVKMFRLLTLLILVFILRSFASSQNRSINKVSSKLKANILPMNESLSQL